MVNKEKVVKGFQCCVILGRNCVSCPYVTRDKCRDKLKSDVFELLKVQKDIVVCKDCKRFNKFTGACKKGHAHGNADTWFCGDGERIPELADDETSVKSEIIQNANGIASRIVCGKCGQELRKPPIYTVRTVDGMCFGSCMKVGKSRRRE